MPRNVLFQFCTILYNNDTLQVTVVAIAGKVVQCHNVLSCSFSLGLLSSVKQCTLENNISSDFEKTVKFFENVFVVLPFVTSNACGG